VKRILLIDNYDSFVYNVVHLVKSATGLDVDICLNDKISFETIGEYSHIILSPGPGVPSEAGDLMKIIDLCKESHSVLGICLGHQAIAQYFGAELINLTHPLHGHRSKITIAKEGDPLLSGSFCSGNENTEVGLYHSWAVSPRNFPDELTIGSVNEDGIIMSLYHKRLPLFGVQFHPESVIAKNGEYIIKCWLNQVVLR
jgi:anthranilate synthase component 2